MAKKANLQHFASVHEGKKPFKNKSCDHTHCSHEKRSFRSPKYATWNNNPQAPSYSSIVKGQVGLQASGNETAAAAFQPLTRGGNPNQTWGQKMDTNQIQMITEIVMQLMKRN